MQNPSYKFEKFIFSLSPRAVWTSLCFNCLSLWRKDEPSILICSSTNHFSQPEFFIKTHFLSLPPFQNLFVNNPRVFYLTKLPPQWGNLVAEQATRFKAFPVKAAHSANRIFFIFKKIFYWSIVDTHYIGFKYTTKQFNSSSTLNPHPN